jgi:hypothetical protein
MDNKVKQEMQKIKIPEELHNRVVQGIENARKDNQVAHQVNPKGKNAKKRWGLRKKVMIYGGVAVLLVGLFICSAFVSPAMARVISTIPYLNLIFESKPIGSLIYEELEGKGYKVSGSGISYKPEKVVEVRLEGTDEEFNEVKSEVEMIVKEILKSKDYDGYSVKVSKEPTDYVLNEEQIKEKTILENEVTKRLNELEYKFDMVQTDPTEKTIFINIVGSKSYYNTIQDDVEKMAVEVASLNNYPNYKINATRVTVEVKKSDVGAQITSAIAEGLMSKKEFKVSGVAYKSKPLSFIIRTSLLDSDPLAKELGTKIETMLVDFMKSDEIAPLINNEPYEIIVYSKDKKKIN